MKTIKVNAKPYQTNANDLNSLKNELNLTNGDIITIYKGFSVNENLSINENDSVVFIQKGEIPSNDTLFELMTSRNSPEVNLALKSARVGIAGLGGLGSNVAIALARIGVDYLKLVDFDTVDPSNLNRQQYFVSDIGKFKTEALKNTISKINPFVNVEIATLKLDENNVNEVFSECKIIAECFDNQFAKAMIVNYLENKTIVAASGMAGYGNSDKITTRKFAKNLYICGDLKSEAKIGNGLMAPRVGLCAMHQANKILELLING